MLRDLFLQYKILTRFADYCNMPAMDENPKIRLTETVHGAG